MNNKTKKNIENVLILILGVLHLIWTVIIFPFKYMFLFIKYNLKDRGFIVETKVSNLLKTQYTKNATEQNKEDKLEEQEEVKD